MIFIVFLAFLFFWDTLPPIFLSRIYAKIWKTDKEYLFKIVKNVIIDFCEDKITNIWRQITIMSEFWLFFGKIWEEFTIIKKISQYFKPSNT